ncbi:MAG: Putative D-methionine transport system permease protein metI [Clostridia bacterium 62_21]|nr:MAG: Putative D-methionine transport system permease protein metI [Clostridia bacterium 62_21]HAG06586.1 methionine ABC transporter permease [Peptococcaceae bacterium]
MFENLGPLWPQICKATWETVYMTLVSVLFATVIGLPMGVILVLTDRGHILESRLVNTVLGWFVNIGRSFPFIILMVAIIPFTRLVVGTFIGTTGAIPPLVVAAAPFVARMVETSLKEVDWGVIEAALSVGASAWQVVYKVLLPEALPGLVLGTTITTINVLGYTAMAGVVGGGGLGDLAVRYGFQRYMPDVMVVTVIILIVMVQVLQSLGDWLARKVNRR